MKGREEGEQKPAGEETRNEISRQPVRWLMLLSEQETPLKLLKQLLMDLSHNRYTGGLTDA